MLIDPQQHSSHDNYKLLTNLVAPRPIAWITSCNNQGTVNLAPFSFFNAVCNDPLYVIVSIANNNDGTDKDTARNIKQRGEFVVNLVTENLLQAMNTSAANFPPDESELSAAGLTAQTSTKISVPRVAETQASFECRLHSHQRLGAYTLFIGEVVMFHVADSLLGERLRIHNFAPIGRMGSPSTYCRTIDRFELPRIDFQQWRERQK